MVTDKKNGFCFPYVVKETPDKGRGVFAAAPIKQGDVVWRHVTGQYIVHDEKTFRAAIEKMTHAEIAYELTHVFGMREMPGCLIRIFDDGVLINHASNANLAVNNSNEIDPPLDVTSPHYLEAVTRALLDERYALIATRDIETGEEFTNDYGAETFDPPFYDVLCEQYGVSEDYLD